MKTCSALPFESLNERALPGTTGALAHPHPYPTGPADPYWLSSCQQWGYPGCCPKLHGVSHHLLVPAGWWSAGEYCRDLAQWWQAVWGATGGLQEPGNSAPSLGPWGQFESEMGVKLQDVELS